MTLDGERVPIVGAQVDYGLNEIPRAQVIVLPFTRRHHHIPLAGQQHRLGLLCAQPSSSHAGHKRPDLSVAEAQGNPEPGGQALQPLADQLHQALPAAQRLDAALPGHVCQGFLDRLVSVDLEFLGH
jgi:hypothetical protein